jgi:hypothetical protein
MRVRTVALLVASAVVVVPAADASGAASERRGTIEVKKRLTLGFPAPMTYAGTVAVRKVTVTVPARSNGDDASRASIRRAKKLARGRCNAHVVATPVNVVHEPPEAPSSPIGSDVPGSDHAYSVTGGSPATDDAITVTQERKRGRFSTGRFRWAFNCKRALNIDLYPF